MSPNPDKRWKLDELAAAAGVSARTVRYYVQRGLLPAPVFRGRDTVYSDAHLIRLQAIRRLQDRFLPLDEIQAEIERAGPTSCARSWRGLGFRPFSRAPSRPPRSPPRRRREPRAGAIPAMGALVVSARARAPPVRQAADATARALVASCRRVGAMTIHTRPNSASGPARAEHSQRG